MPARALRWRIFIGLASAWNVLAGVLTLLNRPSAQFSNAAVHTLYQAILAQLLVLLGAVTLLILLNPERFWPLAWFAGLGRSVAGVTMLWHFLDGKVPDRFGFAGGIDLLCGIAFFVLAGRTWRGQRRVGESEPGR